MIDLERDIHLTPRDLLDQERVRQRRQGGMSLDSYMDFLDSLQTLFPHLGNRRPRQPERPLPGRIFDLFGGDRG